MTSSRLHSLRLPPVTTATTLSHRLRWVSAWALAVSFLSFIVVEACGQDVASCGTVCPPGSAEGCARECAALRANCVGAAAANFQLLLTCIGNVNGSLEPLPPVCDTAFATLTASCSADAGPDSSVLDPDAGEECQTQAGPNSCVLCASTWYCPGLPPSQPQCPPGVAQSYAGKIVACHSFPGGICFNCTDAGTGHSWACVAGGWTFDGVTYACWPPTPQRPCPDGGCTCIVDGSC
jgi:hypothetical protein